MSIFGDQPRFSPPVQSSKRPVYIYGRNATGANIGPGSHFVPELADKRNGWKPNTKSVREPMAKGLREKDRSDYYIKGQLTGDGIVVPYSTDKIKYPSPGQYEPPMNVSYHLRNDLTRSKSVGRSSSMGTSPRMAPLSSTLKKNVLFTPSVSDSLRLSYRGPGSYFHSDDNFSISSSNTSPLRRKSFNVRVQSGNSIGRQHAQKYLSLDQQQQQQTNNLTSPIKLPNSKRNTVKKAWSADEITNPSTPSRGNRTPSHYTQYPMSQIHTPIDLSTNRFTPYHHSYEYNGIRTPKH